MTKAETLRKIPLFSRMSTLEREAIAELLVERSYATGKTIYAEGTHGTEMYFILGGNVGFYSITPQGTRRESRPLGPTAFFGEMALIADETRERTAYAMEWTRVYVLSGIHFHEMVWDTPMLGVKFLKEMAALRIDRLAKASGFLDDIVRWGETARRRAVTDDLSGLFNRRFLEETITARFARGFGESRRCALVMIDFDRFRDINAEYGAIAGDAVIANVGATIQRLVGDSFIPSRLSGDEFAIFLPDSGPDEAMALARLLQEETASLYLEFRTKPDSGSRLVTLTLSIGVAVSPDHAHTSETLIAAADRALYRAKEEGRNRVCLFAKE
jgi:diguanylate cyclase (GGDEF)-like protein